MAKHCTVNLKAAQGAIPSLADAREACGSEGREIKVGGFGKVGGVLTVEEGAPPLASLKGKTNKAHPQHHKSRNRTPATRNPNNTTPILSTPSTSSISAQV
ncbi:unnamed protein product [Dovyalis caffra]|uniref:Uncharacterized protein n=1 Tax=Dovyalis caffra TaxID=77055 RepID=A0AAV1S2M6_9ROSI|nr:unnamed protein product [Dovyalis caffra]